MRHPATIPGSSSSDTHSDPFAAWVSSSCHLIEPDSTYHTVATHLNPEVPRLASNTYRPTRIIGQQNPDERHRSTSSQFVTRAREGGHQAKRPWPPPQHGVQLALQEYYRLKTEYNASVRASKSSLQTRFSAFLGAMPPAEETSRDRSKAVNAIARALVKIAPFMVPAVIYGAFLAYRTNYILPAVPAVILILGTLFWAERWSSNIPAEKQVPAGRAPGAIQAAARIAPVPAEIATVPWKPARGPRLRSEARSRRNSGDVIINRKRRQRASLSNAGSEAVVDDSKIMEALWSGIEEVQGALYGEPSHGEFSARQMGLEEVALEVGRLAGTVGVSMTPGVESDTLDCSSLLQRLAETKQMLGI